MRGRGRRSPSRYENHRSFTVPGSVSRFAPSVRNDGSSFHGKPPQTMEEKEGTNNSKLPTAVVCSPSEQGGLTLPACIGDKDRLPHVERPQYDRTMLSAAVDCYSKDFESSSVPNMGSMGIPSCTQKSQYGQTSMERNVDNVSTQPAHFPSSANLEDEPIFCFSEDRDSLNGKSQHRKISPKKSVGNSYSGQPEFSPNILPFDICHVKSRNVVSLKPSLLEKNREKRKELERFKRSHQLLRPGMVLLKSYISPNDQVVYSSNTYLSFVCSFLLDTFIECIFLYMNL
uniref:Uncharacterized protein n=1 Tax=Nelumbo nucifera TaxID=4432 RepID=A0A822YDM8_NELNU|nr:TPA_asm: hypothetical protein HUJ06_031089 [Nelumbo nucifera]